MSAITTRLLADKKTALINKDEAVNAVVTLLLARLSKASKESKVPLTEQDEINEIAAELKQTREALVEFEKAGREDVISRAKVQIEFIESYLPKQLNEEEIKAEVAGILTELGIEVPTQKDFGNIMKVASPRFKGRADGKLVSQIVKGFIK